MNASHPLLAGLPLHHVGIVQPSFADADRFMAQMALIEAYRGFVPAFGAWCIFCDGHGASAIELVIPEAGTPLEKFNKGAGGLHHIALQTPDIRALTAALAADGINLIEAEAVKGAGDFWCNFLSPVYTRGITIEFVELF
jgi:catechol 2,3-dioxygenase-like lactoylglutathione lyase family enzyme